MEEIDLKELFKFFVKKISLMVTIFVAVLLAGNLYTFLLQKPTYQSYATIVLSSDESAQSITQNDVTLNKNLAGSYAEVIKSRRILDQVNTEIDYGYSYEQLLKKINVTSIDDTGIIKITATESTPEKAKTVANSTAEYFVKDIPSLYKVNNVNILDYAIESDKPSNKNIAKQELIYTAVGIILAAGIAFLIFYFDRTVRTTEQVEQITKLPVVGKVRKTVSGNDLESELVLKSDPKSNISEDIRTIRTNLQFIMNNAKNKVALITSSVPKEGKSFTSANLAIAFAQAGKKTILVDSDLRLGRVHKVFNISNHSGLSNMLADHKTTKFTEFVTKSKVKNLDIITRGTVPPNPSELLNSDDIDRLIAHLREQYDCIIFDGAPINGLSDSLVLANKVDRVFVVCCSGVTDSTELLNSTKSLKNINANVSGIILNKVNADKTKKYGNYGEYYTHML